MFVITANGYKGAKMSKKTGIAAIIIAAVALCIAAVNLIMTINISRPETKDIQYVMYVGTNDKDTNEPVYTSDEAREKAEEILLRNFGGYTIQEASGGWIDGSEIYREYTLVIYLSDTDIMKVHAAADEMISTFNQSSVLIQANETTTEFYAG